MAKDFGGVADKMGCYHAAGRVILHCARFAHSPVTRAEFNRLDNDRFLRP